jgi:hypothetical protein
MEESMSETGSEGSPATPKSVVMQWPMSMVNLPRAATFADFGHHMNGYNVQQPYQHRHSMSGQPYNHRHSLSGDGAHEYPGMPQHQAPMAPHEQPQQHPGVHMLQRTASLPQGYFVPEQNNPGVATMNTNTHPASAQMHPQYQQAPRQGVERLPLEMPPYSSAPGLSGSLHSSPSPYSPSSGRSPAAQDGFYTHAPTAQAATYALHAASPVEQQQPQVVNYQGQIASQQPVISPPTQPPAVQQQPPQQQPQAVPEPYPQQHGQAEAQHWYNGVAYQPPVTIELPGYGPSVYDWDGPKCEYADPSMQLPSDRIANM